MIHSWLCACVGLTVVLSLAMAASAQTTRPGVVCNVKVLSDKVVDVSSAEAWAKSYLKPSMSEKEKALACWRSIVAHEDQNAPPNEYLHSPEDNVLDPIKMFNVYGYSFCSVASSHMAALSREAGLTARGYAIMRHNVAEVMWDDQWHMLDASLVNYFPKPDGQIASVDEILAAVAEFYKTHPELKGKPELIEKFRKEQGWKNGPKLLADCPFYDKDGMLPANYPWQCGWSEAMTEYNGQSHFIYEPGYSMGYRVNVQLRQGERLTRNWFHKGLHVMMDEKDSKEPGISDPPILKGKPGEGPMRYTPEYGDLAPGRVGNGVLEYEVPLASGAFRGVAMVAENLAAKDEDGKGPALHLKDPSKSGVLIIRMPSSYVYLGGTLGLDVAADNNTQRAQAGQVTVSFSDNNGLDWKEIKSIHQSGKEKIDLKSFVFRRYDYQLKFELTGPGMGLESLVICNDIQHSQRPLPALTQGKNTISFSAGPAEGTITIEGSTQKSSKGKQVLATDFHPTLDNIVEPMFSVKGDAGSVTFPVTTPGAMKRLRVFTFYRARGKADLWTVSVSFDGGKTFKDLGSLEGPTKAMGKKLAIDAPAGTTAAIVRYTGKQKDGALLFNVRIDADYAEPQGGFVPVKVTYVWEENGVPKRDVHVASKPDETWTIECAAKPLMKSLIVEQP